MDEIREIDLDDLVDVMVNNVKEDIKNFDDVINISGSVNRELLIGEITDGLGASVDAYIRYWNQQDRDIPAEDRKPIKLYIDSCGGSLSDTFTIIDSIKLSMTPVIGICTGAAYSGGFFILIACDKRIGYPHSTYLFHEGATGNQGTSGQFENYTAFYKKLLEKLKKHVIENTSIDENEYKIIKREDIWYDAEEALEKKIIDEITGEFI
jgi:ATP-dependent Clp protease protease subunit